MNSICPLCASTSPTRLPRPTSPIYYHCPRCDVRFLDSGAFISRKEEHLRYSQHHNDHQEAGYRAFIDPLVQAVREALPPPAKALDFGAGEKAPVAGYLRECGYEVALYDPCFFPDTQPLNATYDVITACEVIEHLHTPGLEFKRLASLLKPGGILAVMTLLYSPEIDFENWFYRRDPTHVVFYTSDSIQWIRGQFGFATAQILPPRTALLLTSPA